MCSGSEGAHFVMLAAEEGIRAAVRAASGQAPAASGQDLPDFELVQLFACESHPGKRKFIDRIVNAERRARGDVLVCIFCDIRDMGKRMAQCHTHEKECQVPDVNVLLVSTSCKDLSNLSASGRSSDGPVLALEHSPGGSADTFRGGLLPYLDNHEVDLIIYENSDNVANENGAASGQEQSNLDIFSAEVGARHFEVQCFLLNSKLFGLPQSRRRFWAVLTKTFSNMLDYSDRSIVDMFNTLRVLVECCQRKDCPAIDLFLPDSSQHVVSELLHRSSAEHNLLDPNRDWFGAHQKVYSDLRLSWGVPPPCSATAKSPWFDTLTPMQKSTLVLQQYRLLLSQPKCKTASGQDSGASPRIPSLMINISPSISWKAPPVTDTSPCMVPNQIMWVNLPTPRLMLGREALLFQGWPSSLIADDDVASDRLLGDLAGNAVSLPVQLAMVLSTFHAVPWRIARTDMPSPSTNADVDEALQLLSNII